jgi:hypothetical protein
LVVSNVKGADVAEIKVPEKVAGDSTAQVREREKRREEKREERREEDASGIRICGV